MLAPRGAVKFSARCKEADRQYEQNNNADLDNGVYHLDDEEEAKDNKESDNIASEDICGQHLPKLTDERPESRMRGRALDEASIADSFNQEHLQS